MSSALVGERSETDPPSAPAADAGAADAGAGAAPTGTAAAADDQPTRLQSPGVPGSSVVEIVAESAAAAAAAAAAAEADTDAQDLLGARLDHFELLDCIGRGGMGRVFRARDTVLERLVAIKVLDPALARDGEIARRFEQEAKSAARLDDPYFARVYFYGRDRGVSYIAMEYVDGENLRQRIAAAGALAIDFTLDVGLQLAQGLVAAGEAGLVHRDIKPSNILVTADGACKLVDMGLARTVLASGDASTLTQDGATLGTFDYISPEQARDPRQTDARSDIYSLGCTLFHMVTGQVPFGQGTAMQKLLGHQSGQVPDARSLNPLVPPAVAELLQRMMATEPAGRPADAAELIAALVAVAGQVGVMPHLPLRLKTPDPAAPPRRLSFMQRQTVRLIPTTLAFVAFLVYLAVDRPAAVVLPPPAPLDLAAAPAAAPSSAPTDGPSILEALAAGAGPLRLPAGEFEIPLAADQSLTLAADRTVVGAAAGAGGPTVLRFVRAGGGTEPLLRVAGGAEVRLAGVALDGAGAAGSLLALEDGRLTLDRCDLRGAGAGTAAAVRLGGDGRVDFEASGCTFRDLAAALRLQPQARGDVRLTDCGATGCDRLLDGDGVVGDGPPALEVRLRRVTAVGGDPALLRLAGDGAVTLDVQDCVFSAAAFIDTVSPEGDATLVRLTGRGGLPSNPWWSGTGNWYHGYRAATLIDGAAGPPPLDWPALGQRGFRDADARRLPASRALFVRPDAAGSVPTDRLRLQDDLLRRYASIGGDRQATLAPAGIAVGPWGPLYRPEQLRDPVEPPPPPPAVVAAKPEGVLVVDPAVAPGTQAGVYRTLRTACAEAASGYRIRLRSDETIDTAAVAVPPDTALTIEAAPGFRPSLSATLADDPLAGRQALFRLGEGASLTIEQVPLRVAGRGTVIDAAPGSRTVLRRVRADLSAPFALDLWRPARAPRGDGAMNDGPRATLTLDRCDVRCGGAVVDAGPQSLWDVAADGCFIASLGPLLRAEGDSVFGVAGSNNLRLRGSTLLLDGPLARLLAGSASLGPEPPRTIYVDAVGCVVAGAGDSPLTHVTGSFAGAQPSYLVSWKGRDNLLAGFPSLFRSDGMGEDPVFTENRDQWLAGQAGLDARSTWVSPARPADVFRGMPWSPAAQPIPAAGQFTRLDLGATAADLRVLGVDPDELPAAEGG